MHDPNDPARQALSPEDVEQKLTEIPEWEADVSTLSRTFPFKNFIQGMNFANAITGLAEEQNHHPDLLVQFRKVTVTLTTHSAGAITEQDFMLAAKIDKLPEASAEITKPEDFLAG